MYSVQFYLLVIRVRIACEAEFRIDAGFNLVLVNFRDNSPI